MNEPVRFFLPGPVWVRPEVLEAMTEPVVGHRSPAFRERYAELQPRLREVFRTTGEVMLAVSSATLVMEAAVRSAVPPGGRVLHLISGAFSERFAAATAANGIAGDRVEVPWGRPIDPDLVRQALGRRSYDVVTVVHNETSTGTINPLEAIARTVREASDALVVVDAVSSLAGAPVETDTWGLDLVLTASQKALAVPPGLAVFTLSDRYAERAARVPHRGFYTDLLRYRDKHRAGGTITTTAVSLVYALDAQLDRIAAEGIEARWLRHRELRRLSDELAARHGFTDAAAPGAGSPTVTCLEPPAGIEPAALVAAVAHRGFTVAGGYGDWKPSTFRIGHMGEIGSSDLEAVWEAVAAAAEELAPRRRVPAAT